MRSRILILARAAISASILALILSRTSLEGLAARAGEGAPLPLAAALALALAMAVLVALRWRLLAGWIGLALPARLALRAVFLGLFGGQLLPSALGTDLLRGWVVARHTGRIRSVAASLIGDRLVALFAACLLLVFAQPSLARIAVPYAALVAPAAVLVAGALLAVFLLACTGALKRVAGMQVGFLRRLDAIDGVTLRPGPILAAIAVAVAIHAIAILAAALAAAAYGIDAPPAIWLSIIPLSVIAAAVPISINGWGVREAVIVALAAGHGVAPADALLVSLTLGVLNVAASLPGAYLMLPQRSDTK